MIFITIIRTRYEDAANNNIKFDSSKFDYSITAKTFPTDVATDFEDVIYEIGAGFNVIRQTTTEDATGKTTAVSEISYNVTGYISDITKKDRQVHEMGLAVPGNRILYVMPVYTTTSAGVDTDYSIREGDILTDRNDNQWRVIKIIHEPYISNTQIYTKALVQSIDLKGSG